MPLGDHPTLDQRRLDRSRLGESLLRLRQNLEQSLNSDVSAEDLFRAWEERWSDQRDQIARRLEMIDGQLDALLRSHASRPQLSVVGTDSDAATE